MEDVFAALSKSIVEQGFAVTMLGVIAYYFYDRQNKLEQKVDILQKEQQKYLQEDRNILLEVVKETKDVLEQNTRLFEKIERKI